MTKPETNTAIGNSQYRALQPIGTVNSAPTPLYSRHPIVLLNSVKVKSGSWAAKGELLFSSVELVSYGVGR